MPPDESRPRIRILVHGAERSGPPIYALRLARWWAQHPPPFRAEFVIARPGPLLMDLAAAQDTSVARLDRGSPERVAERALRAAHLDRLGTMVRDRAVRHRVGTAPTDLTVLNGATAPTTELLRALEPADRVVLIAHELSTGWFHNISAGDRDLLLRRVSSFLAVSESVRTFLTSRLGVDPAAITVIPPPVSPTAVARPTHDADVVLAGCGVTDWRKAPDAWLRVMAAVRHRIGSKHLSCRWVGGESAGDNGFWPLEHEMRQLRLEETVEFLGTVPDPWVALGPISVLVTTAREDAHPLAVAEAIAGGVPVVGFDVDGVGEMIRESGCGVAVPYPDESAMADAVAAVALDPELRRTMATRGVRWAAQHVHDDVVVPRITRWLEQQCSI